MRQSEITNINNMYLVVPSESRFVKILLYHEILNINIFIFHIQL